MNDHSAARIHLVADTVGGEGFWNNVAGGRPAGRDMPGWQPRLVAPMPGFDPALDFESVNAPIVMSPWEMREHMMFMLGEAEPSPQLQGLQLLLLKLARRWHALWSAFGTAAEGWPRYRALLDEATPELRAQAQGVSLRNGISFMQGLSGAVLDVALVERHEKNAVGAGG